VACGAWGGVSPVAVLLGLAGGCGLLSLGREFARLDAAAPPRSGLRAGDLLGSAALPLALVFGSFRVGRGMAAFSVRSAE